MLPELIETANLSETLDMAIPARVRGTVWSVDSNCVEARGLAVPVGAVCKIERIGQALCHRLPTESSELLST